MDLFPLHNPTSMSRTARPPTSEHTTDTCAKTPAHCQVENELKHWRAETQKMDTIAKNALAKLEKKKTEVEAWRTRYNEIAAAQKRALAEHEAFEAEKEEIKSRLITGGKAVRELQAVTAELARLKESARTDKAELARLKESARTDKAELTRLKESARTDKAELSRLRDSASRAQAELAKLNKSHEDVALKLRSTQAKLGAAGKEDSASIANTAKKLEACVDMLSRAEQVLQTCCELQASKNDASPLAEALKATTKQMGAFLKTVQPKSF
jgi:chromosome segregation ATPase